MSNTNMRCKICKKEIYSVNEGKEPTAFMAVKPKGSDDVRCKEHKSE